MHIHPQQLVRESYYISTAGMGLIIIRIIGCWIILMNMQNLFFRFYSHKSTLLTIEDMFIYNYKYEDMYSNKLNDFGSIYGNPQSSHNQEKMQTRDSYNSIWLIARI